ncbi:hypothetical protein [Leptospira weilii]|uniref:hypothetical protein n=1 Tax=Leptospira weilii TaxID=28184 RepID=UPI0002BFA43A|nr:hypothetical protein [Leptospira weilii]EMN43972.1 hypothetical protein LEP1GSC086_4383 [Leptospira weilii str. LNT 1234]
MGSSSLEKIRIVFRRILIGTVTLVMIPISIVLTFPFLILGLFLILKIDFYKNKKLENEYENFLLENEGQKFFCYTSRESSEPQIRKELIPLLGDVNILYLKGRDPKSGFPSVWISRMLYRLKNVGFPNVMVIRKGTVFDVSLKKETYELINANQHLKALIPTIEEHFKRYATERE